MKHLSILRLILLLKRSLLEIQQQSRGMIAIAKPR
jgi:hypothetical protein